MGAVTNKVRDKIYTNDGELEKRGGRRGDSRSGCLPPAGKFVRGETLCIAKRNSPFVFNENTLFDDKWFVIFKADVIKYFSGWNVSADNLHAIGIMLQFQRGKCYLAAGTVVDIKREIYSFKKLFFRIQ